MLKISSLPLRFFTSPVGTKVNVGLDVALDTEPEFDFLYLSVKSSGDVEDFLINSKGVNDITKTFDGVSGGNMTVKGIFPFTTKSEKFSVALKFVLMRVLNSLVLLLDRSLSLLLEIFHLV
ncbi:hypothetical protein BASA83_012497 [Batrachochytrium salamandrivorans]|nr:hypothetical protein BASA83_012497 [Batrachochytrium salamandrivorans]